MSTRVEIKEDIQANIIRGVKVLSNNSVRVRFWYIPSPEISIPKKGKIPSFLTFYYNDSSEFMSYENRDIKAAESRFLLLATGGEYPVKSKQIGRFSFTRYKVPNNRSTESFISFGRIKLSIDPYKAGNKIGVKLITDCEKAPIFSFLFASKKPYLRIVTR